MSIPELDVYMYSMTVLSAILLLQCNYPEVDTCQEIENETRQYSPSMFKGCFRPNMFASKEEVMEAIENSEVCTVNTLSHEIYKAAQIMGSSCLPTDLMQGMNSFLPDDQTII